MSTYRIYKDNNGNELKKEKVYVSYYPKKQGVVAVGTMDTPVVEEPQTPPVAEVPSDEIDSPNDTTVNQEQQTESVVEEQVTTNP